MGEFQFELEAIKIFELDPPSVLALKPKQHVPSDIKQDLFYLDRFEDNVFLFRHHSVYIRHGGWHVCQALWLINRDDVPAFRGKFAVRRMKTYVEFLTFSQRPIIPRLVGPESGLYGFEYEVVAHKPIQMAIVT